MNLQIVYGTVVLQKLSAYFSQRAWYYLKDQVLSVSFSLYWKLVLALQITDGERLPLAVKELGSCDLYPQVTLLMLNSSLIM